ncbi:hypothetical protein [Leptolyngbya sp. FACHB-711]|uniref:hypothetical protein n=1 Tax=Leptolyngbya sp. FACHB-711 TaxID=2692813 RepID=UPI00168695BF|nr:hypothetical protein [Leptolyngbya sp. FACHB-711]MBD1852444.1 hypothetical protein [Cyanobacteria bacterium FACHB-502]MBD2028249.1 hypothetical protein [Leptolyngbya sp. FACHB-711]
MKIKLLQHQLSQKQPKTGQFNSLNIQLKRSLACPTQKAFSLSDHFFLLLYKGEDKEFIVEGKVAGDLGRNNFTYLYQATLGQLPC